MGPGNGLRNYEEISLIKFIQFFLMWDYGNGLSNYKEIFLIRIVQFFLVQEEVMLCLSKGFFCAFKRLLPTSISAA
jgi:hypothetical protein